MITQDNFIKYDDYAWHYKADYPAHLPNECAATHIGQFFRFCIVQDLISEQMWKDFPMELTAIKNCRLSGAKFLIEYFRGSLLSSQFNQKGRCFIEAYYDHQNACFHSNPCYLDDYSQVFHLTPAHDLYAVADSYTNYFLIEDVLLHRFEASECYNY